MKRILTILILAAVTGMCILYACKKSQNSPNLSDKLNTKRSLAQTCTFVDLTGTLTTQTLSNSNVYRINGNVIVPTGVTLTIPAGTVLLGVTGGSFPARLIVEQGGTLNAIGTSTNPIIFTSDQAAGSRAPGDWGGIAIGGKAPTNKSSILFPPGISGVYTLNGGGSTATDNSGTLEYVQINFAGNSSTSDKDSYSALVLLGVGTGTTIDHVQVNNSGIDGIGTFGGTVKESFMVSYNAKNTDFQFSDGYKGNAQFLAAMSLDNSGTPSAPSYGINITNRIAGTSTLTPVTQPVISNITVMGPNFCNASTVSTNFVDAIRFGYNGTGKVYNSVFSSWNGPSVTPFPGLIIDDAASIAATLSNDLEFSDNSFHNSGSTPYTTNGTSWSGGCSASMLAWITGTGTIACRETGNQFSVSTLGYDATFCDDFCGNGFSSNFVLGTTNLMAAAWGWDTGSVFSHPTYRGAFGTTDFTQSWAQWCAQNVVYCN